MSDLLLLDNVVAAIDIMDWCKTHRVPWKPAGRGWANHYDEDCVRVRVLIVEVEETP